MPNSPITPKLFWVRLLFHRCFLIFFVFCATLFSCVVSLLFCSGFVVLLLFRRCFIVVVSSLLKQQQRPCLSDDGQVAVLVRKDRVLL